MVNRGLKLLGWLAFAAYIVLLIKLVIFKFPNEMNNQLFRLWSVQGLVRSITHANYIPFRTIGSALFNAQLPVELPTLIYNIIAFMPFGFLLPFLVVSARKPSRIMLYGIGASLALEVVQLMTLLGEGDIDDVILNVTGTLIGYALFRLILTIYLTFNKPSGTDYETEPA
jgi:glycopeptide antibiotics resistance protein